MRALVVAAVAVLIIPFSSVAGPTDTVGDGTVIAQETTPVADDGDDDDDFETDEETDDNNETATNTTGGTGDGLTSDGSTSDLGLLGPIALVAGLLGLGALARRLLFSGSNAGAGAEAATSGPGSGKSLSGTLHAGIERLPTAVGDGLWRFLGAAGYVKWAGKDPLKHDTRAALYDHLQAEPGTYLSAFDDVDAVDASMASVRYHLEILERESLIASEKQHGKRRYYPIGAKPDALTVAMSEETPSDIIEALAGQPDTVSGLAEKVNRHPSTVTHHLDRLEEEGIVNRERDGEAVVNRLTPGVEKVVGDDVPAVESAEPTPGD